MIDRAKYCFQKSHFHCFFLLYFINKFGFELSCCVYSILLKRVANQEALLKQNETNPLLMKLNRIANDTFNIILILFLGFFFW